MRTRLLAVAAVFALLPAFGLLAQSRGTISGTVADGSGQALPGVTVEISGPDQRRVTTDDRGRYAVTGLLPGAYRVRFLLPGFQEVLHQVAVSAGGTVRLNATLLVAAPQETVSVAAEALRDRRGRADKAGEPVPLASPPTASVDVGLARPAAVPPPFFEGFRRPGEPFNTESYSHLDENPVPARRRRPALDILD